MAEQWVITKLDELTKAHAALEAKVEEIAASVGRLLGLDLNTVWKIDKLEQRIAALEPPAENVLGVVVDGGDLQPFVGGFTEPPDTPAPDPAPLDPVLVEAAAKAAWEHGQRTVPWDDIYPNLREELIKNAEVIIRAYVGEATRDE